MLSYRYLGNNGRLGNCLWQIASTMGLAFKRYNVLSAEHVQFPNWHYQQYLSIPDDYFRLLIDNPETEDLGTDYLQDFDHFQLIEPQIRKFFAPSELSQSLLEAYYPWFKEMKNPISLHVRRGDAVGKEMYHPIQPINYYYEALMQLPRDSDVLVFSDDINWCQTNLSSNFHYVSPHLVDPYGINITDVLELFLMSRCSYHIIANSTFSLWGAYLSNSLQVFYPSNWYGPGLPDVNWRLMIKPDWKEIKTDA